MCHIYCSNTILCSSCCCYIRYSLLSFYLKNSWKYCCCVSFALILMDSINIFIVNTRYIAPARIISHVSYHYYWNIYNRKYSLSHTHITETLSYLCIVFVFIFPKSDSTINLNVSKDSALIASNSSKFSISIEIFYCFKNSIVNYLFLNMEEIVAMNSNGTIHFRDLYNTH